MRPLLLCLALLAPPLLSSASVAEPLPLMAGRGHGSLRYDDWSSCPVDLLATLAPEDGGATLTLDSFSASPQGDPVACETALADVTGTYPGLEGSTAEGYSFFGYDGSCFLSIDVSSVRMVNPSYSFTEVSLNLDCPGAQWRQLWGMVEFAPYVKPETRLASHRPGVGEGRVQVSDGPVDVLSPFDCPGSLVTVNFVGTGAERTAVITAATQTSAGSRCAAFEGWVEVVEHVTGSPATGFYAYYTPDGICEVELSVGPLGPATSLDLRHHCSGDVDIDATLDFPRVV